MFADMMHLCGLHYFITVQQSKAPGRHDIRYSCADAVNEQATLNNKRHFYILHIVLICTKN